MKACLTAKPMYCSREYFKTSRLIQQYKKSTLNVTVVHHTCEGFLRFVLPEDTVTVDMEVMTLKGIHTYLGKKRTLMRRCLSLRMNIKIPPSSFSKRLRETQDKPYKEFLESMVDRNLEANFRPRTANKCPKIARMSDSELIQDIKLRKNRQRHSMTETQVRPPRPSRRTPIPSDRSEDDRKEDQARAPIA